MPRVWNKRDPNCPKDAVYIGRPGKWGNPWSIGTDGTREEVIAMYRRALPNMLTARDDDGNVILDLAELRGKNLQDYVVDATRGRIGAWLHRFAPLLGASSSGFSIDFLSFFWIRSTFGKGMSSLSCAHSLGET